MDFVYDQQLINSLVDCHVFESCKLTIYHLLFKQLFVN